MENSVILFDIDYTLFDVAKYRQVVFSRLHDFFPEIENFNEIAAQSYAQIRQSGWFEITRFTKQLLTHIHTRVDIHTLEDVWRDEALLAQSLYPESLPVLTTLSKLPVTLGIFSSGFWDFQKSKITKVAHFFEEEHIHIHILKDEKLPEMIKKYQGRHIIVIDDYIPVIQGAKKLDKAITTIWIKRGILSEKVSPSADFIPDYTIQTLDELLPIIEQI